MKLTRLGHLCFNPCRAPRVNMFHTAERDCGSAAPSPPSLPPLLLLLLSSSPFSLLSLLFLPPLSLHHSKSSRAEYILFKSVLCTFPGSAPALNAAHPPLWQVGLVYDPPKRSLLAETLSTGLLSIMLSCAVSSSCYFAPSKRWIEGGTILMYSCFQSF